MAAASSDLNTIVLANDDANQLYDVVAADRIYKGTFIGIDSGNARPLTAGDPFLGVCRFNGVDNTGGAAGDLEVEVATYGILKKVTVTGVTAKTDILARVYASDDATLTLTATSNSLVGRIIAYNDDGTVDVYFASDARIGVIGLLSLTPLTDDSGGTASDTIADITDSSTGGSADRVPVENAIASLAAKQNAIIAHLAALG